MILRLFAVLLFSAQVGASQGLTINDQILTDYRNAKTFQEFVEKLTKNGFPGDYQYIQQAWKAYPELLKDSSLPKVIFEKGQFVLRDGPSEIKLQKNAEFGGFQINGNKVVFALYEKASSGMKKIMEASRSRKTAHFALMPVIWAAESEGLPSKLQVAVKALVSVLRDEEGVPQDLLNWQMAESVHFRTENRTALMNNVGDRCLKVIETVEQSLTRNKAPFYEMKCEGGVLEVRLQGTPQKQELTLNLEPRRLAVHRGQENYTFVNKSEPVDEITKGYAEDEPVSATSSPFQRDMNFEPKTKRDQAGIEFLDRFMGLAADREVTGLCGACPKELNEYSRLVKAYNIKTLQFMKAKSDAREKTKSSK